MSQDLKLLLFQDYFVINEDDMVGVFTFTCKAQRGIPAHYKSKGVFKNYYKAADYLKSQMSAERQIQFKLFDTRPRPCWIYHIETESQVTQ